MAQETDQSQAPLPCSTGCGFYGSPRNDGMCSVCYHDALQRRNSSGRVRPLDGSPSQALLAQCSDTTVTVSLPPKEYESCSGASIASASAEAGPSGTVNAQTAALIPASEPEVGVDPSIETREKQKGRQKRCFTCRRRIGLIGFDCRCGNAFCGAHRYSDAHNCTYDYKADAAEKIRKENPVIIPEKVQRI